jgi:hypothetical protein
VQIVERQRRDPVHRPRPLRRLRRLPERVHRPGGELSLVPGKGSGPFPPPRQARNGARRTRFHRCRRRPKRRLGPDVVAWCDDDGCGKGCRRGKSGAHTGFSSAD